MNRSADIGTAWASIFDQTGRIEKTHNGAQTECSKLARVYSRFDAEERRFLGRAYNMKVIADYDTGSAVVSEEDAGLMLVRAKRFVATVIGVLPSGEMPPSAPDR